MAAYFFGKGFFAPEDVRGAKISRAERRAKYIKIYLDNGKMLLMHLRMTGRILIGKDIPQRYLRFVLELDSGEKLVFADVRKFGTVKLSDKDKAKGLRELLKLGPEPFNLKTQEFVKLIGSKKRKIKQVLMDQTVIAGIGNIYADEALWMAKIHPLTLAADIGNRKLAELFAAIKTVFKRAIKLRGTSSDDYVDTSGEKGGYFEKRYVYQREGEPCPRCGTPIKRIKIGGRSAHFCPKEQIVE